MKMDRCNSFLLIYYRNYLAQNNQSESSPQLVTMEELYGTMAGSASGSTIVCDSVDSQITSTNKSNDQVEIVYHFNYE